jgi:hypothetical protein
MALQRFTGRTAEAAQGTGEAKDALASMGITLRDQDGHLRRSEDLLADVADAFARIEDPAERVRLAFKLFDSEGVALVNLLSDGSGALYQMRERARDLGIVLDEHLVRDAERARTELDTLAQVVSANLTRAALEPAPVIADLSSWLADVAGKAGIAWERLFDAPQDKSLRTLRYELDLTEIAKLQGRIDELRKSPTLGFTTYIDTAQISALQKKIDELSRVRGQTQARIAFLEGPPEQPRAPGQTPPPPDDTASVKDRGPSACSACRRTWRIRCSASPTRAASGSSPSSGSLDVEADPQTWFAVVALEFAAFRGAMVKLTADKPVADSTDVAIPWDATVYDTDTFWSAGTPTRLTVPAGVSRVRLKGNIDWAFGGSGYRHVWIDENGGLFFGMGRESDEGDAGVQSIGSAVVDVAPGDYFELIGHQTSGSTKRVAADELTWFAIEVVE